MSEQNFSEVDKLLDLEEPKKETPKTESEVQPTETPKVETEAMEVEEKKPEAPVKTPGRRGRTPKKESRRNSFHNTNKEGFPKKGHQNSTKENRERNSS